MDKFKKTIMITTLETQDVIPLATLLGFSKNIKPTELSKDEREQYRALLIKATRNIMISSLSPDIDAVIHISNTIQLL